MGSTLETVVFYFLAAFIIAMSIMTVTTQRIVRSATYLLFVLFGTAGIYFLLGYTFLGSVQIMVYAGGIVVLYVFSILLTSGEGDRAEKLKRSRKVFFSSFLIFKRKKERSLKTIVNKEKKKEKPKEEEGGKPSRKEEGKYKNFKGESAPAKMTILDGTSIAILHRRRPYRTPLSGVRRQLWIPLFPRRIDLPRQQHQCRQRCRVCAPSRAGPYCA